MRCEDCLPLVEEYFDGEVEGQSGELMGAHLATCETCAAALDALSFEQEIYARYDRGLEVSPALWARVSAEIAREPLPESPAPERPFLSRVGERLAAALAALTARPALASSLALLLVGVTAGSLWLARKTPTRAPEEVAVNVPTGRTAENPTAVLKGGGAGVPGSVNPVDDSAPGVAAPAAEFRGGPAENGPAANATASKARVTPAGGAAEVSLETLLAETPAAAANFNTIIIRPDEHAGEADEASALADASLTKAMAPDGGVLISSAGLLDPAEKDVARHVERTQMLLRSFTNARAAEGMNTVNVAYERKLSRRLLAESATLKLDAETRGDKDTRQVLDSIEPFLLDIANLREEPSREEVRSIRERVTKNEIIAALQVY